MSILSCSHQVLAQDIDPAEVKVLAAAQKPYNQSITTEKSGPPAWKQLPNMVRSY